ncbi:hypothetical protein [Streptomyces sp. NPDC056304]|uniref:hypothetical protein n=1 Tax=Streptomyces sp. NPDC056304 TaxID=3345778 RepID=UPI0035D9638A
MLDPELLEPIIARRAELDELEEQLAKQLAEVRAELVVAERVLERISEQLAVERASVAPAPGQVGGRAVMLIPHRTSGVEETTVLLRRNERSSSRTRRKRNQIGLAHL